MNPAIPTEVFSLFATASWRAAWLIVVLLVLRRLVRGRIPAQVWFAAWLVVALRLLLPFSIPVAWSPYNLAAAAPAPVVAIAPPMALAPAPAPVVVAAEISPPPAPATSVKAVAAPAEEVRRAAPAPMAAKAAPVDGRAVAALVWIAGVILIAAVRLLAAGWFRRQLAPATPLEDGRVTAIVAEESKRHGRAAAIPSFETDAVDAPALYGVVRPRLLFPPGFARQLDDAELRLVVRHELAHWRRRDLLAQALLQTAVAVHWFNPLAWLAARVARLDCELACDEFVLRRESRDGVSAYGATLLKVLGVVRGRRRPGAVVAIIEGRQQLAQRVRMIADYRGATLARVLCGVTLVAAVAAVSLTRESHAAAVATSTVTAATARSEVSSAAAKSPAVTAANRPVDAMQAAPAAELGEPTIPPPLPELDVESAAVEQKLSAALGEQQRRMKELALELSRFKQQNDLTSLDQKRDMVNAELKLWHGEVLRAQQEMAELELRAAQVKEYQARGDDLTNLPFLAGQPVVAELKRQAIQKRVELGLAHENYLERHPKMITATNGLAQLTEQLRAAVDAAIRQNAAELQAAARRGEGARQKFAAATRESLEFDRLAAACEEKQKELQAQTRNFEALRDRRNELVQRSTRARIEARRAAEAANPDIARAELKRAEAVLEMSDVEAQRAQRDKDHVIGRFTKGEISQKDVDDATSAHAIALGRRKQAEAEVDLARARLKAPGDLRSDATSAPRPGATAAPAVEGGFTVSVLGAVRQQGALTFGAGEKPILLDVIARAGGFSERANRGGVQLVRAKVDGGREAMVFTEAELTGPAGLSQVLQRGDVVIVAELAAAPEPGQVSILGAVMSPGQFTLPAGGRMNLIDLLARAGGGTRVANYKAVILKRVDADGSKKTYTINAEALMKGGDDPSEWRLRPGDIVTVPERIM